MKTFIAKGALDLEDPRCLFTVGIGQRDYPQSGIDDADLVITIGYDPVEYGPGPKVECSLQGRYHPYGFLPAESDAHYQPQIEVVGDLARGS